MTRIGRLLNTTVTVWREQRVTDEGGGHSTTWTEAGTVRARLSQPSGREAETAQAAGADITQVVYLPAAADVRRGDQLRRGSLVLDVIATVEPSVPGTYLRADCTTRQSEAEGEDS
jgi:SPP1 family predicted phage head-tail adaptor